MSTDTITTRGDLYAPDPATRPQIERIARLCASQLGPQAIHTHPHDEPCETTCVSFDASGESRPLPATPPPRPELHPSRLDVGLVSFAEEHRTLDHDLLADLTAGYAECRTCGAAYDITRRPDTPTKLSSILPATVTAALAANRR